MPLMVDCFLNSQRRADLGLWPCPTLAPLNDCARSKLALSSLEIALSPIVETKI